VVFDAAAASGMAQDLVCLAAGVEVVEWQTPMGLA